MHKQYGDLVSIRFFHHHLIFVGGSKTTNELLVKRGDVLGKKPYFFIGTEIFQNAGNQKACFLDTLEKKKPIDIFIFLNFYQYNLENTILSWQRYVRQEVAFLFLQRKLVLIKYQTLFKYTHITYVCKHIYSHHYSYWHVNTETYRTLIRTSSCTDKYSHWP